MAMDHWKRVEGALSGERLSTPLCALWRHFPEDDQQAERLAARTTQWQQRWDFDLVKFMPSGTYAVEDWGATSSYRNAPNGAREVIAPGIRRIEDWARLHPLDTKVGSHGRQNQALALAAKELKGQVPILQTVFSPLTTARKLAGERLFADLRCAPELLAQALRVITDTTIGFALEALRCGAHGVFFATQLASHRLLTHDEYVEFGRTYDLQVLNALRGLSRLNMLHVHGVDVMFDSLASYPVEMINWHDRLTEPSLRQASESFSGLLVGGLNEGQTMASGSSEAIEREVHDALAQCSHRRLMIAPGCVLHTETSDASIEAVLRAAASCANR